MRKIAVETLGIRVTAPLTTSCSLGAATRHAIHASVTGTPRMQQQITIVAARGPIVAKNDF